MKPFPIVQIVQGSLWGRGHSLRKQPTFGDATTGFPALNKINSFSDNTSSSRIFSISKWPVISRWQSPNTWYSSITVSFTVTEPHYVPNSFPIPHLFIFSTFTNKDVCHSLVLSYRRSGSVCRRLKLSSSLVISSQMIGRWTWECFCSQ